jgi:anthranilate synthase component II
LNTLIIDNYDSFVYNLHQYVGELGGNPIVFRNDEITVKGVQELDPDRIILSPGPGNPSEKRYFGNCGDIISEIGKVTPLLGVCLGHQGIVHAFGGKIERAPVIMHGKTSNIKHDGESIYSGIPNPLLATRYHSLAARRESLPASLKLTSYSLEDDVVMGVRHREYPIEGIQFHPESILTSQGKNILGNFLERGITS